jgi:hypothetical protein
MMGVALVLAAPFAPPFVTLVLIMGGLLVASLGSIVYSYVAWRQEKRT